MIQPLSATSRVLKIGMTSTDPELDLMELSMTAYWKIRARLLRVPGVANVPIWGERRKCFRCTWIPSALGTDVKLQDLMNVVSDSLDAGMMQYTEGRFIGRGGWIETARPALGSPPHCPHRQGRGPGTGSDPDRGRRPSFGWETWSTWSGTISSSPATP